jgi:hypothetical protein
VNSRGNGSKMNFETKYLIRWGIPGWVFILFSYSSFISVGGHSSIFKNNFTVPQLLGILISLGFIGVVIGYLMHQVYFSSNWIFTNQSSKIIYKLLDLIDDGKGFNIKEHEKSQHKAYYAIEYQWQRHLLLLDDDKRKYISERYSYLLTTIHGLGALLVSIICSLIFVLFIGHNNNLSGLLIIFIFILLYLGFSVYKGFKYYSDNLIHFQAHFFNSFQNKEFSKTREKIEIDN